MFYLKAVWILAVCTAVATLPVAAQQKAVPVEGRWLTIEMACGRQNQQRLEFGLGRRRMLRYYSGKDTVNHRAALAWGPQCNLVGFVNRNNVFRLGQKTGLAAEYNNVRHGLAWGFKMYAGLEYYTKKDLRLSVEGGPLISGILHLQYGCTIPAGKHKLEDIPRHRLGIMMFINTIGIVEFLQRHFFNGV